MAQTGPASCPLHPRSQTVSQAQCRFGAGGVATHDCEPWEMGFIRGHLWRPATMEDILALGLPRLHGRYVVRGG